MFATEIESPATEASHAAATRRFQRLTRLAPAFNLLTDTHSRRHQAESYIGARFFSAYAAELADFLPLLLTMECNDSLSAVAGITPGSAPRFFLEQYLPSPVEKILAEQTGTAVDRERIAEIGNLVATNNGASLAIFIVLACALAEAGFETLMFTATDRLRQKFQRLGFKAEFIAHANESALRESAASSWGSYYAQDPQVMTGSVQQALQLIESSKLYGLIRLAFKSRITDMAEAIKAAR